MKRRTYTLRDGDLSVLHFGDMSEPVRLVFLHANGFNAQSYRTILELELHLPKLTDAPVVLAGHSFGAVSAILAAPFLKGRLSGYAGFDPVSVPRLFRLTSILPGGRTYMKKGVPIARNAGRRKSKFETPEAAFARWQGRGAFKGMDDKVLRDYISGGLVERGDGVWELACDPKWEQAIFVSQWHNVFKAARALPDNSKIIYAGGRPPVSTPRSRRAIQNAQPQVTVKFDPRLGHLFPFTEAEKAVQALQEVLFKS